MPQQRINARLTTAKFDEQIHRLARAALFEDGVEKLQAGGAIEYAVLFELGERVGRQHFGPFIAVVTGRVTAGKDVREAVRKAVE